MRKRLAPFLVEERPGLILEDVLEAMYNDFNEKNPELLKISKWKEVLAEEVWNIKKAYRSTCLDRVDTNYKWMREALEVAVVQLKEQLQPTLPFLDVNDGDDGDSDMQPDPLMWLPQVATLTLTLNPKP